MKRIAITVLLLLCCMCVSANAANFVEIARDEDALIYVDADSIELRKTNNNEYVVAWLKFIYRGEHAKELSKEYKKTVDHNMTLLAFKKNIKQHQLLSRYIYDKKGSVIDGGSWSFQASDYREVIPDTYGEAVYDFVLFYYNKNK